MRRQSISSSRVTSDSGTAFGRCEPARNTSSETVSSLATSSLCLQLRRLGLRRLRGAAERLRDAVRIEDHDDRPVAEDGGAGEHPDVPQLRRHRLDDDFLGVEHAVDDGAEHLIADLDDHDEAAFAVGCAETQDFLEMKERQQRVAQPQHRRVLDPLDAVLAGAAGANQFEHGELRNGEALARHLDDQRRDNGERQRNLDDEGGADAGERISNRPCRRSARYCCARRPCRRRGRKCSSLARRWKSRARR